MWSEDRDLAMCRLSFDGHKGTPVFHPCDDAQKMLSHLIEHARFMEDFGEVQTKEDVISWILGVLEDERKV